MDRQAFDVFGKFAVHAAKLCPLLLELCQSALEWQQLIVANPGSYQTKKHDGTSVTIFDAAIQMILIHAIHKSFSNNVPILGEESEESISFDLNNPVFHGLLDGLSFDLLHSEEIPDTAREWWTIDPIDGTDGFILDSDFALATALMNLEDVVFSATAWPRRKAVFVAAIGQGAWIFDSIGLRRVTADLGRPPCGITPMRTGTGGRYRSVYEALSTLPSKHMSSMTKGFAVCIDEVGFYCREPWGRELVWDIAPFTLFVKECGGFVTGGRGEALSYRRDGIVKGARRGVLSSTLGREFHAKLVVEWAKAYRYQLLDGLSF